MASTIRMTHQAIQNSGRDRPSADSIQLAHDGHADAHAVGVVNAVDPSQHKINLTHEPIPALGWPSMTMDFPVAASVDLSGVKPGARVDFILEKGKGGMYEIQSVRPAGAR
jgi:Cu/Ag efflux protein CusF